MKTIKWIPGMILMALASFVAGAFVASDRGWGQRVVFVEIRNATDQPVRNVTVQFDSCGGHGTIPGGEMAPGASRQIRYQICGEAGQAIEATFADGMLVKSAGQYVESGYRTTATISRNIIVATTDIH